MRKRTISKLRLLIGNTIDKKKKNMEKKKFVKCIKNSCRTLEKDRKIKIFVSFVAKLTETIILIENTCKD